MLLLIVFFLPSWLRPPGGLSRGCGLDPLPESGGLAPLQEHLPGVVRHGARGRPVQRRRHGPVRLRHPALRLRARGWEEEQRKKIEGERNLGKNHSLSVRGAGTGEGNEEGESAGVTGKNGGKL